MDASNLHVVTCIFNPKGYKARTKLYHQWLTLMKRAGVTIHVIECTYKDSEFTTPIDTEINQIRVSSDSVLWAKENLLNIAIDTLPLNAEYLLITDADIFYENEDFSLVIMEELDKQPIVQAWSHCYDLGPDGWPIKANENDEMHTSFGYYCANNLLHWIENRPTLAHPGYCWAYKKNVLKEIGGLFEYGILGGADTNMALAWADLPTLVKNNESSGFTLAKTEWSNKAKSISKGKVGYADLVINHGFHGYKVKRFYVARKEILVNHDYDPERDLRRNESGVLEFTGNKPQMEIDIADYFASREEDEDYVAV